MHFVHILTYSFENGGASKVVYDLAKFQIENGDKVTILHHEIPGNVLYTDIPGVKLIKFKPNFFSKIFPLFSLGLWKELKNNSKIYDVIHLHGLWNFSLLAGYLLKLQDKCVVTVHGCAHPYTFEGQRFKRKLFSIGFQNRFLRRVKLLHLLHQGEKRELIEQLGIDSDNVVIVPNGIDIPQNLMLKEKQGNDVLFLSRLHKKKGIDLLLPAFKELLDEVPDARLLIAGPDFGMFDFIENYIIENNLQHKIVLLGSVQGERKNELLKTSKIFVLPSYSEGFSIAVLEALVFELPIIVSSETGLSDEIIKNEAGIVVDLNSKAILEGIKRVLLDKDLSKKLAINGKSMVLEKFETSIVCGYLMHEIEKAFSGK